MPHFTTSNSIYFLLCAVTSIVIFVVVGSSPYFEVDRDTGEIRTTEAITSGLDYVIKVYALDSKATVQQKTDPVDINIRRGQRPPQFYSSSYVASVEESNQADQT